MLSKYSTAQLFYLAIFLKLYYYCVCVSMIGWFSASTFTDTLGIKLRLSGPSSKSFYLLSRLPGPIYLSKQQQQQKQL